MVERRRLQLLALLAGALVAPGLLEPPLAGAELTRVQLGLGRRVLLLADMHIHGKPNHLAIEAAKATRPDIVVVAGDTWDEHSPGLVAVEETLREIRRYTCCGVAVLGNHEEWTRDKISIEEGIRVLEDTGYTVLIDADAEILGIRIAGLRWRDNPRHYEEPLHKLAPKADIIVSHSPDAFNHLPGYTRRLIMLSGHTHGGQWCLPGGYAPFTNSIYGYRWGLYRRGEATLYVSRGLGEMIPPRLYCRYQAVLLE
ncbi:hypothetical protein Pdsh_06390 [Pyrodictium delaneyi]|uniref:Calcineurin-like phosphoesterase domain-containing protein n=1 Tax=Pyrodictium delaneyi TaxID=1273541 RepID=A0A211YNR9_9CREN|nr:hypothetical protein Pdsh_06390 [Pyrodictium delaneyi]